MSIQEQLFTFRPQVDYRIHLADWSTHRFERIMRLRVVAPQLSSMLSITAPALQFSRAAILLKVALGSGYMQSLTSESAHTASSRSTLQVVLLLEAVQRHIAVR